MPTLKLELSITPEKKKYLSYGKGDRRISVQIIDGKMYMQNSRTEISLQEFIKYVETASAINI